MDWEPGARGYLKVSSHGPKCKPFPFQKFAKIHVVLFPYATFNVEQLRAICSEILGI